MFPDGPVPIDEIISRLEHVLAVSPAEITEISWLEARRGQESNGKRRRDTYELHERNILLRVRQSGRSGLHRTSACGPSDLENALREALAQARLAPPSPPPLPPPGHDAPIATTGLCDAALGKMTAPRARELFQGLAEKGETIRLGWTEGRIAVANSRGLRRAAEVTSGWLEVIRGRHPGAGRAAAASRSLAGLNPSEVIQRARQRQGPSAVTRPPEHAVPLLLSQEATAGLIELLSRHAFSSDSFHSGVSFLRERLGQPVFHPSVHLRDDPTDPRGLPFPFDLLGAAAQPIDLVKDGVALTPAADNRLARDLGVPPTPQRVAPDEAVPGHLFLLPGSASASELLQATEGGVWIAALDPVEIYDPRALRFRAVARGARGIAGGQLARSLPDLIWEDDLQSVLFRVLAIGSELVSIATGAGLFRASTAPMIAVAAVHGLRFVVE